MITESFCHNCSELVTVTSLYCPQCRGLQLEQVDDPSSLQPRIVTYTSPPNVTEVRAPLIINRIRQNERGRRRPLDISKLEKQTATSELTTETDCSICLARFAFSDKIPITSTEAPSEVSQLLCGHIFHFHCAKHWFNSNARNECPLCRQKAL